MTEILISNVRPGSVVALVMKVVLNLVPMDGNLNKSAWKQMENTWANALKEGKTVDVNIQPIYSGNNTRPDRIIVQYSINGGRPVSADFKNSPGGK